MMNRALFYFIGLSPAELKYYQFMVIIDKCSGSCSSGIYKKCVPSKKKDKIVI